VYDDVFCSQAWIVGDSNILGGDTPNAGYERVHEKYLVANLPRGVFPPTDNLWTDGSDGRLTFGGFEDDSSCGEFYLLLYFHLHAGD